MHLIQKIGQEAMTDLLKTKNLNVRFKSRGESIHAVKDLSFRLSGDEVLGIVGSLVPERAKLCFQSWGF